MAAAVIDGHLKPAYVWSLIEGEGRQAIRDGFATAFPPEWKQLLRVDLDSLSQGPTPEVWNQDHPLIKALDAASWEWAATAFLHSNDPIPHRDELMRSAGRVAAWMVGCINQNAEAIWTGLTERDPTLLPEAWSLLGLAENERVLSFEGNLFEAELTIVDPNSWTSAVDPRCYDLFAEELGEPASQDWWLTKADPNK